MPGKWYFDAKAGRDEILFRRVGANELDAIDVCRGFVEAQKSYALDLHDDSHMHQYAQRIISTPGKQDGLYWKNADGTDGGPISETVAKAIEEGYAVDTASAYHGYIFHVLTAQGPAARLGELDYLIGGAMIGGFALIATPAEYGVTGVQTFIRQLRRHRASERPRAGLGGSRQADHPLQPGQDVDPHERRVGEVKANRLYSSGRTSDHRGRTSAGRGSQRHERRFLTIFWKPDRARLLRCCRTTVREAPMRRILS